jgi:hypothetical protein
MRLSLGHQLELDRENNISKMSYFDEVTDDELLLVGQATPALMESYSPRAVILDFTRINKLRVSTAIVRKLSQLPRSIPEGIVTVIVAPGDLAYGLARMFQILKDSSKVHVVRDIEAAYTLLEVTKPEFLPLDFPLE